MGLVSLQLEPCATAYETDPPVTCCDAMQRARIFNVQVQLVLLVLETKMCCSVER
jgi:hypothetical protein